MRCSIAVLPSFHFVAWLFRGCESCSRNIQIYLLYIFLRCGLLVAVRTRKGSAHSILGVIQVFLRDARAKLRAPRPHRSTFLPAFPPLLGVINRTGCSLADRPPPQPYLIWSSYFKRLLDGHHVDLPGGSGGGARDGRNRPLVHPPDQFFRPDLLHRRSDSAGVPARAGAVFYYFGGPRHRLPVRGNGGGAGGDVRLSGGTGAVPGTASSARLAESPRWPTCSAIRWPLTVGRGRPGTRPVELSSCCWSRTAAFRSTTPTRTWS